MIKRFPVFINYRCIKEGACRNRTKPHVQGFHKMHCKGFVYYLLCYHYKFNTVAGCEAENFGNTKLCFNFMKLICQVFLANYQFSQFLQFNLFMRKSYYL